MLELLNCFFSCLLLTTGFIHLSYSITDVLVNPNITLQVLVLIQCIHQCLTHYSVLEHTQF